MYKFILYTELDWPAVICHSNPLTDNRHKGLMQLGSTHEQHLRRLAELRKFCHFFQSIQSLLWNKEFIIDVSFGKTVHRKHLLPGAHFSLPRDPTFHKNFKEISSGFKFSQISFFTKKCSEFFSFNLLILKFWFMSFTAFFHYWLRPKNNTLVSGNAGDEKNLHPGGHKFIFLNRFSGVLLFSSLVSFALFDSCFCRCCYCLFVVFWT